jgi:imidazolonepropionase-like amidohydrolase
LSARNPHPSPSPSGRGGEVILFQNASVLDVERGTLLPDQAVLIEGERIKEIGPSASVRSETAGTIDLHGRVLMPGLIDCHVHALAASANLGDVADWSPMYVAAHAAAILKGMLARGFTTVRDVGGGDHGLAQALEEGLLEGPRLIYGGRALSQTGGHADSRARAVTRQEPGYPWSSLGRVCDGVDEVRRAVREEIKRGAQHIKLMLSGGVASPTDRVDSTQFSDEEIRAAVEEASAANIYVAGHAYTARAVERGLRLGVRSIEHGNLMSDNTPSVFLEHRAFYVPTLVTYSALAEHGREHGLSQTSHAKVFDVLNQGLHALGLAHRAGVQIAYGTDLLGAMHAMQSQEFRIRREVQPAIDIVRSATIVGARLVRMEGQIGVIAPDAKADLLVVDGNPLEDIGLLAQPDQHLQMIMKGGRIYKMRE